MSRRDRKRSEQFLNDLQLLREYEEALDKIDPARRAGLSITRRLHLSKRPTAEQQRSLKIHSHNVGTVRLLAAVARMQHEVAKRFNSIFEIIADPGASAGVERTSVVPEPSRNCPTTDADKMIADGILHVVSEADERRRPTLGVLDQFSVLEIEKDRRRAIMHPYEINKAIVGKYTCHVPLEHISAYLPEIERDCGAVFDLKCGFWQVQLPERARAWYRFRDASGRLLEMNRLLMGHRVAVEIMQLLASVVAGDPDVVRSEYSVNAQLAEQRLPPVGVSVWVDGFRFTGSEASVIAAAQLAKANAAALNATFKDPDFAPKRVYDYIGLHWDHRQHVVRIADKTLKKIQAATIGHRMTAGDLEALVGRLIFAAGATQLPLADYYFTLKWSKRKCNQLNSGALKVTDEIDIPDCVVRQLRDWVAKGTKEHRPRLAQRDGARPILFVDATPENYGAVLVTPAQQIFVTGSKFADGTTQHISVREAQAALYAMQDFQYHLRGAPGLELRIDNTTAEFCLRRGLARTAVLADVVRRVIELSKLQHLPIYVERVASDDNPADEPSRLLELNVDKLAAELAKRVPQYQRRGAGRIFS